MKKRNMSLVAIAVVIVTGLAIAMSIRYLDLITTKATVPAKPIKAEVNVSSVIQAVGVRQVESDRVAINLTSKGALTLDLSTKDAYLGQAKFDRNGAAYARVFSGSKAHAANLVKIDVETGRCQFVAVPDMGEGELLDFDIGQAGQTYVAIQWKDMTAAIFVLGQNGGLVSKISTPYFVPSKIFVDAEGRIWAKGTSLVPGDSLTPHDVQVRVFNPSGELLGVPLGGFPWKNNGPAVFFRDGEHVRFIHASTPAVFEFAGTKFLRADSYAFLQKEWRESAPGVFIEGSKKPSRLVLGVKRFGDNLLWYGTSETVKTGGRYDRCFLSVTTATGEVLLTESVLPTEYKYPTGIADDGSMFFYDRVGEQVTLKKVQLALVPSPSLALARRTGDPKQ